MTRQTTQRQRQRQQQQHILVQSALVLRLSLAAKQLQQLQQLQQLAAVAAVAAVAAAAAAAAEEVSVGAGANYAHTACQPRVSGSLPFSCTGKF